MFNKLTTDNLETQKDSLGGGFTLFDSGIYPVELSLCYVTTADSGAIAVNLVGKMEDGREYREALYVTSKSGTNFYYKKDKDGKPTDTKVPLQGFTLVNDICLMVTGEPLSAQETEEKSVRVWDSEAGAAIPKSLPVITGLTGGSVYLGIQKQLLNKNEKDANGIYQPVPGSKREQNAIDKVFHIDSKQTVNEANAGQEAAFYASWEKKFSGEVVDKRKNKDEVAEGAPSAGNRAAKPAPAAGNAGAAKPMFGKRS